MLSLLTNMLYIYIYKHVVSFYLNLFTVEVNKSRYIHISRLEKKDCYICQFVILNHQHKMNRHFTMPCCNQVCNNLFQLFCSLYFFFVQFIPINEYSHPLNDQLLCMEKKPLIENSSTINQHLPTITHNPVS